MAAYVLAMAWILDVRITHAQTWQCHERCVKCHLFDYSMEWHCIECEEGYELWVDGCFDPCGQRQFRNGYVCEQCTHNCESCSGPLAHECLQCSDGYTMDQRGLCVRTCFPGYYSPPDGAQCQQCDAYCLTCVSGARTSCTSCSEGYRLRVMENRTMSGECMLDCPDGFFRDASDDLRCIQCPEFCSECWSTYNCTRCFNGSNLFRGVCYNYANAALEDAMDFEAYLSSGAGRQWDESDAPTWDETMR